MGKTTGGVDAHLKENLQILSVGPLTEISRTTAVQLSPVLKVTLRFGPTPYLCYALPARHSLRRAGASSSESKSAIQMGMENIIHAEGEWRRNRGSIRTWSESCAGE